MSSNQAPEPSFLAPRYWPTWMGMGLLKLICKLPYSWQITLGRWLGIVMYHLFASRRHITDVNLRLCFPQLTDTERQAWVKQTFIHNAIGLFESSMSWWAPDSKLDMPITLKGEQHLKAALAQGRGVILLGGHFSTLDLGGRLFSRYFEADVMYRQHNNPLMDKMIREGRGNHLGTIERENLRQVLRALRKNRVVWYAPDQDFGPKYSVYAPFFGQDAATITATSRLVKLNNSPILMFSQHRNPDNKGYELEFFPIIEDFPSGDEVADASRINAEIERAIRKDPCQYMWVHRRFKTHPKGKNYLYRKTD